LDLRKENNMGLYCLTQGHEYEKINDVELWEDDLQDSFMATNNANWVVKSCGFDLYRCKKCLKEKRVYTGNHKFKS
jgi:hypothetical protein